MQNPFVQIRRYEHLLCEKNISPNTYVYACVVCKNHFSRYVDMSIYYLPKTLACMHHIIALYTHNQNRKENSAFTNSLRVRARLVLMVGTLEYTH